MKKRIFLLVYTQFTFLSIFVSAQSNVTRPGLAYLQSLFDRSVLFDTSAIKREDTVKTQASLEEWRQWHTVANFYYGKNRGLLPMIADLRALHPYFRDKVTALIKVCKAAGIELAIVESYRTPAKQAEYYSMGRKYTNTPGGKSKHQYGLAVDVVPIVDSVAVWNNHRLWRKIGQAGERLGLRWGGRWHVTYDPGHFEWGGGLTRQALAAGNWPAIPASVADEYPTIGDELAELQKNWQAWAVEQSAIANNHPVKADEETVGIGN
ncbi:MAG TPA: M15 family metallopeptidase [Chryseosolibacter sp.]